jgi:hypothetical protein
MLMFKKTFQLTFEIKDIYAILIFYKVGQKIQCN